MGTNAAVRTAAFPRASSRQLQAVIEGKTMSKHEQQPPKVRRKFATSWGELDYLCRRIHYWLYARNDRMAARRYLRRLGEVLQTLPDDDLAIVREEALALFHQLKGENDLAIKHRQREIDLIQLAQKSVHQSVQAGRYDEDTATSILAGRDKRGLQERRAILKALRVEEKSTR
jgi:hypothetical protein